MAKIEADIFNTASVDALLFIAALALFALGLVLNRFKHKKLCMIISCFTVLSIAAYLCLAKLSSNETVFAFNQLYVSNQYTNLFKLILVITTMVIFLLAFGAGRLNSKFFEIEFVALSLITLLSSFIMISANDLVPFYLGLELQFICSCALLSLDKVNGKIIKYFFLNLLFSAVLLLGIALLYTALYTTNFSVIIAAYSATNKIPSSAVLGFGLLMIGLVFKLLGPPLNGLHSNTSLPTYMLLVLITKSTIVFVLLKLLVGDLGILRGGSLLIMKFAALAFMSIGAAGLINQTDIKQLMTRSALYNIGWILLGVASNSEGGAKAAVVSLIILITALIGLYALIAMIEATDISSLKGLGKAKPIVAHSFTILALSVMGFPPLAGFLGRFQVMLAIINAEFYVLAFLAIITMIAFAFYFFKLLRPMYFDLPKAKAAQGYSLEFIVIVSASVILNLLLISMPSSLNLITSYLKGLY
jgi:NADH-quinone oxidoreductase subunit N